MPKGNYRYQSDRDNSELVTLGDEQKRTIRTLIANLIIDDEQAAAGMVSRIHEMGDHKLSHDIVPQEMPLERAILRTMYRLDQENMPATREAIFERVSLELDDVDRGVENLLVNYRTQPPQIGILSFSIHDWIERQRIVAGLNRALQYAKDDTYFSEEVYQNAMQIISDVAPNRYTANTKDADQAFADHRKRRTEEEERIRRGDRNAPLFPWKGMNDAIQNFSAGEMMTILARSKHGKTTLGIMLAESMAFGDLRKNPPKMDEAAPQDKGYYDVAFFNLETDDYDLYDRIVCRHLQIPGEALPRIPILTGNNKVLRGNYGALQDKIAAAQRTRGMIHYCYEPGINFNRLQAEVKRLKALADARGRELVVIVDYYGPPMDWSDLAHNSTQGYNELATKMKSEIASTLGVRMIVFAQRNIDAASTGKKTPWNGSMLVMRSQIVMQLERGEAESDSPVMIGDKPKTDGTGSQMYYHRKDEPTSDAVLNITFANRNPTKKIPLKFLNSYFAIYDNPGGSLEVE